MNWSASSRSFCTAAEGMGGGGSFRACVPCRAPCWDVPSNGQMAMVKTTKMAMHATRAFDIAPPHPPLYLPGRSAKGFQLTKEFLRLVFSFAVQFHSFLQSILSGLDIFLAEKCFG